MLALTQDDVARMKAPAPIMTDEEVAEARRETQARREAEMAAARARKERMLALEEEARARVRQVWRALEMIMAGRSGRRNATRRSCSPPTTPTRTLFAKPPSKQAPPPEGEALRAQEDALVRAAAAAKLQEQADEAR